MEKEFFLLETIYNMTHIPIRYLDKTGDIVLFCRGYEAKNDPVICDAVFRKNIINNLTANELPILEFEGEYIYGIFCDSFEYKIVLGPICLNSIDSARLEHYAHIHNAEAEHFFVKRRLLDELCAALANIYFTSTGKCVNENEIVSNKNNTDNVKEFTENDLQSYLFEYTENEHPRYPFSAEMQFIQQIREGDIDGIRKVKTDNTISSMDESRVGKMARKTLKQNEYLAVTIIILASRAAIDGGLDALTSYMVSELFLQRLEGCDSLPDIFRLVQDVVVDYAERVNHEKLSKSKLSYIEQCKKIINRRLNKKFTLDDIAKEIGINKTYIARRFSESEGIGIQQYAQIRRVEAAANMLKYSNESILTIANYLCFTSQSHFGRVFKEHMGITPQKYREKNKTTDF